MEQEASNKKRTLPSWMREADASPSNVKSKNGNYPERSNFKGRASKVGSAIERTVYLMTSEEFLSTAHDIIRENEMIDNDESTLAMKRVDEQQDNPVVHALAGNKLE
ncbi:uncharacterized protein LOC135696316 [Rhopilema esculentum]|uniref:uncharacterized protein LOC135696316 n=1 Tax=Rhopilema esculentum TaxID=499914 RepID=UPI0031D14215